MYHSEYFTAIYKFNYEKRILKIHLDADNFTLRFNITIHYIYKLTGKNLYNPKNEDIMNFFNINNVIFYKAINDCKGKIIDGSIIFTNMQYVNKFMDIIKSWVVVIKMDGE